jgi:hypothetical protein
VGPSGTVVDLLDAQSLRRGESVTLHVWAQPARDASGFYKQLQNLSLNVVASNGVVDILDDAKIVNPGFDLNSTPGIDGTRFTRVFDSSDVDPDNPVVRLTTLLPDQIDITHPDRIGGLVNPATGAVTPGLLAANPTTFGIKPGVGIGPWPLPSDSSSVMTPYGPAYHLASFTVRSLTSVGEDTIHLQIGASGMNHAGEQTSATKVIFAPPGRNEPVYSAGPGLADRGITLLGDDPEVTLKVSNELTGDYSGDAVVDGSDLLLWQRQLGPASVLPGAGADGNKNGFVDADDLQVMQSNSGRSIAALVVQPSDFTDDGVVDGADFLRWQRNLGSTITATRQQGDATGDGAVDDADLSIWQQEFGVAGELDAALAVPEPLPCAMLSPLAFLLATIGRLRNRSPILPR